MYLIFTSISQRLDIVLQLLESQVVSKRPSFGLQKVAFYNAKDGLSQREKPSFARPPAVGRCPVYSLRVTLPLSSTV